MHTLNIKTSLHQIADQLPDSATWEHALYEPQIRHDIEKGLEDVQAGRLLTTDQVRQHLGLSDGGTYNGRKQRLAKTKHFMQSRW